MERKKVKLNRLKLNLIWLILIICRADSLYRESYMKAGKR